MERSRRSSRTKAQPIAMICEDAKAYAEVRARVRDLVRVIDVADGPMSPALELERAAVV